MSLGSESDDSKSVKISPEATCQLCGRTSADLKVYRDPFGAELSPGRWPTLTLHFDCFLEYVKERKRTLARSR